MRGSGPGRRKFARIDVRLRVRFRVVRGPEAEQLQREVLDRPSVWAPEGESELMKMATRSGSGAEGLLAQALLDIARQVGRLSHRVLDEGGPTAVGELVQLSGSGGLLSTHAALVGGVRLDMRLADDDPEAPPVRMVAEILGGQKAPEGLLPLTFLSIHPTDQERLIRFIHSLQRRQLRRAHRRESV